jgi:[acyl-carrier-protein] S-malonyltransferase
MKTAMIFPGMGPGRLEHAVKYMLVNPTGRDLLASADKVLGYSLIDRYLESHGDYGTAAQVLFMVHCLALARSASQVQPDFVTGPSFGGRAAAAHTGVLTFEEAVWMTARLAEVMSAYFAAVHTDVVTHSVVRVSEEDLGAALGEMQDWSEVSCRIDADFFMVSLRENRVEWLSRRLASVGGLSLYTMRPAMHASIFGELRSRVDGEVFGQLGWRDPGVPVVADQDGGVVRSGSGVRGMLLDGFVRAVQWPAVVGSLVAEGVGEVVISGVDRMFGRVRCTTQNFSVVSLG